jgi:hypothetical protein
MGDIRITVKTLVDDWIDIVLYYDTFRVRLKASFFVENPFQPIRSMVRRGLLPESEDVKVTSTHMENPILGPLGKKRAQN